MIDLSGTSTNFISSFTAIFSNEWVVGIGGGILSGLIVTWVSNLLFSRKENKEYSQKVIAANTEILYSLRPLISEATFPSAPIVDSVISATAKKHQIKKENMNTPMQFFDELIKEVMDSNFIPHKKKSEYCTHLYKLKTEALSLTQPRAFSTDLEVSAIVGREKMFNVLSVSIGVMVTVTTMLLTLSDVFNKSIVFGALNIFFLPIGAALLASIVGLSLSKYMNVEKDNNLLKRIQFFFEPDEKNNSKKI